MDKYQHVELNDKKGPKLRAVFHRNSFRELVDLDHRRRSIFEVVASKLGARQPEDGDPFTMVEVKARLYDNDFADAEERGLFYKALDLLEAGPR